MNSNILKNSSINIVVKFLALGIIFIFQSSLSKFITVDSYSEFSKFIVYSNYISLLFSFGLSASLLYYPSEIKSFLQSYLSTLIFYIFILFLFGLALYVSLKSNYLYVYIVAFSILQNLITVSLAYFQFNKRFTTYAFLGLFQALLILSAYLPIYLLSITDIKHILQLYIAINSIYFIAMVGYILLSNKRNLLISFSLNKKHFSYGIKIVSLLLASQFIYITDYFLIDYYLEDKNLAFYFVAMVVSKMIFILADTVGSIIFPLYARLKGDQEQKSQINDSVFTISTGIFFISVLSFILFLFAGKQIITLFYSTEYIVAYVPILLLIAGAQGMIIYKLLSRRLAVENQWKVLYISVLGAGFLNLLLNMVLIPKYGINGAAFSSMVSYWICGISLVFLVGDKFTNYLFFFKKGAG